LCRSTDLECRRHEAGFTLLEALVALAVVAGALAAIGSLVATNIRGTRAIDQRLALVETSRAILTGLPDRGQLVPGNVTGEIADHRWRLDVLPFAAPFVDPRRPTPWVPQAIVVRVQSPSGQILRLDTVRLHRGQGSGKQGSGR
jgi:general secretion pathway protein I